MKICFISILGLLALASCQTRTDNQEKTIDSTVNQSSLDGEYKPDPDQMLQENMTGLYQYVNPSGKGYSFFEFDLLDAGEITGEVTMILFGGKNDLVYKDVKDSLTYKLEILGNDSTHLVLRPEMPDANWEEMEKRFPGFEKVFFRDGSGWPMQNLVKIKRRSRFDVDLKAALMDQSGDSITFTKYRDL